MHIRDFSINPNSGISNRGKYLGMVEAGAKTPEGEKSGLDHLEELGITHVHLLPVNDYAGGDERQKADEYSWYDWGYDPVLFNAPEGSYSSEPLGLPLARRVGGGVEQGLNGRGCDGGFVHKKFGLRCRWAAGRQCVSISHIWVDGRWVMCESLTHNHDLLESKRTGDAPHPVGAGRTETGGDPGALRLAD